MRLIDNILTCLIIQAYASEFLLINILLFGSMTFGTIYSTVHFVNIGSFINRISDEEIGGTYLTM